MRCAVVWPQTRRRGPSSLMPRTCSASPRATKSSSEVRFFQTTRCSVRLRAALLPSSTSLIPLGPMRLRRLAALQRVLAAAGGGHGDPGSFRGIRKLLSQIRSGWQGNRGSFGRCCIVRKPITVRLPPSTSVPSWPDWRSSPTRAFFSSHQLRPNFPFHSNPRLTLCPSRSCTRMRPRLRWLHTRQPPAPLPHPLPPPRFLRPPHHRLTLLPRRRSRQNYSSA